jgi:hypothetical protein
MADQRTRSVHSPQSIKQDIGTVASNMGDFLQVVCLPVARLIATLLRERTGPALLSCVQSLVDSGWTVAEGGSQVGMVRHPEHGTCVAREECLIGSIYAKLT